MYPFFRLGLEVLLSRRAAPLALGEPHVSRHRVWPWDLDPWIELNNGRTLTLYDLGRLPMILRSGLDAVLRAEGWGITVAGASVRYRRRVRAFEQVEMRSALTGRDDRFFYVQQAMLRGGDAVSHSLLRSAVTGPSGIVPTDRVMQAAGRPDWRPDLPDWVAAWAAAETLRPWPPQL